MVESSSNQGNVIKVDSGESIIIKPRTMVMDNKKEPKLLIESAVDFKSLKRTGCDVLPYIGTQDLDGYFSDVAWANLCRISKSLLGQG